MPTNDERREVAARLRQYVDFDFGDSNPYWYLMKAVYGDVAIHDDNELFDRLAELLEPEPERACRPILHGNEYGLHDMHCGDCCSLMLIQRDGTEEWPIYCCQCGTRVEVG